MRRRITMGSDRDDQGTGQSIIEEVFVSENIWRALILISTAAVLLFSVYCLSHGITIIFMHLYYFPIVLLAYRYRYRGCVLAAILSLAYVGLVVFFQPELTEVIGALCRLAVFIGIAAVVAYLSERLAAAYSSQKERLETIQNLQQFQESIIANANFWITVLAPDGTIIVWNDAAETICGYKRGDVLGKRTIWRDLYPDKTYRQEVSREIQHIIKQERYLENFETKIRCVDGTQKTMVWNTRGIRGADGSIQSYIAIGRDITEQKRAEEALLESEEKYRAFFSTSREFVFITSPDGTFIDFNDVALEILGYDSREELASVRIKDLYANPAERDRHIRTIVEQGFTKEYPLDLKKRDGSIINTLISSVVRKDSKGNVFGFQGTVRDITARKRMEEALKESEEKFREIFNSVNDAIHLHEIRDDGLPGKFIDVNDVASRMVRYSKEELMEMSPLDLTTDFHSRPLEQIIEEIKTKGSSLFETEHRRKDGVIVPVEVNAYVVVIQGRRMVLSVIRDLTRRKRDDAALRKLNTDHKAIIDNAPAMIWYKDTKNNFVRVNPAAARTFGKPVYKIEGVSCYDLFPDLAEKYYQDDLEVINSGKPKLDIIEPMITASGEHRWVQTDKIPLRDEQGTVAGILVFAVDITERKRAEDALLQANKQLNLLSSITRHDILNQLMALKGYLELSQDAIDNPTTLREYIIKEEKAANTIEHQITFTRDYQNLGVAAPEWQNVNASIQHALHGLPMRDIHIEVDPKNPEIFADRLFEKVFYNLIDNALRHGGDRMKSIRVSVQESDASLAIVCEDDGMGISEEDKKRLFTRGFGRNTGLGLFLSREILAITGITITENGIPGTGARFEIVVPKGMWRMAGRGA
jgi:PAS domain S-box-containing protein